MFVVGAKEDEAQTVSYRDRIDGNREALPLAEAKSDSRSIRQTAPVESHAEDHAY